MTLTDNLEGKICSFNYIVSCVLGGTVHHLSVLLRHTYANSAMQFTHAEGRGILTPLPPLDKCSSRTWHSKQWLRN